MEMKSLMTRVIFTSRRFLCGPWPLQPHFLIRRWIVQLASDKDHRTRGRHETGLVNAVAFLFFVDDRADIGDEVVVGGAFAKERAQVMIFPTEQAGAELAVGRDPDSRTKATEGLCDRGDEADFAGRAIGKAAFASGFAALVGNLNQVPALVDAAVHLSGRNDELARPVAIGVKGHEFDEAHDDPAVARELGERLDFIVVQIGRAHVRTPVTWPSRMPSAAGKKK